MVTIFHDLIHKSIKIYVDDILAKSSKKENYLEELRFIFERMRQFNLKLNLKKCVDNALENSMSLLHITHKLSHSVPSYISFIKVVDYESCKS